MSTTTATSSLTLDNNTIVMPLHAGPDGVVGLWPLGRLTVTNAVPTGTKGTIGFKLKNVLTGKTTLYKEGDVLEMKEDHVLTVFLLSQKRWFSSKEPLRLGWKIFQPPSPGEGILSDEFILCEEEAEKKAKDTKLGFTLAYKWHPEAKAEGQFRKADVGGKKQLAVVLKGGGAKGIAYVGAFKAIEEKNLHVNYILGTSAGAITALAIALGYSATEVETMMNEKIPFVGDTDKTTLRPAFECFLDNPLNFMQYEWDKTRSALNLSGLMAVGTNVMEKRMTMEQKQQMSVFVRGARYQGLSVLSWLALKMNDGGRNASTYTFVELYAKTGIHLSVTGSDMTSKCLRIFNHITTPNCPVLWAVRISMSIPVVWPPIQWQEKWGKYTEYVNGEPKETSLDGHVFADGGLLSNFPIRQYTDQKAFERVMTDSRENVPGNVIGLFLEEEDAAEGVQPPPAETQASALGMLTQLPVVATISSFVNTVLSSGDLEYMGESSIVKLPVKYCGTLEFNMAEEKRRLLNVASQDRTSIYLKAKFPSE